MIPTRNQYVTAGPVPAGEGVVERCAGRSRREISLVRSDSRLPGARHAGCANSLFDGEACIARLRLCPQAARDGIEESTHERKIRVRCLQLTLDAIDELQEIFLIAARKGHRDDLLLHGD